jgi:hypothetical protein
MADLPTPCLIDTGVPLVANRQAKQASPECVTACADALDQLTRTGRLVLDSLGGIVSEYQNKLLHRRGPRGPGDEFLLWVFTNQWNPARCERVTITKTGSDPPFFAEFPQTAGLARFDPSDCKFVATANAHPCKPPIVVSVDTDWADCEVALAEAGIRIHGLCPPDLAALHARKRRTAPGKGP